MNRSAGNDPGVKQQTIMMTGPISGKSWLALLLCPVKSGNVLLKLICMSVRHYRVKKQKCRI